MRVIICMYHRINFQAHVHEWLNSLTLFQLSVSQSERNHSVHPLRPARSSSVTRSSISASQYSTYSSNRSTSILNTSSASVSSYTRPASPSARSVSSARPSTPSARPTSSRSSTPSRTRPSLTSSSMDKTRTSQTSRPSTPSSRPQIPANLNSSTARSSSRPSTPTRRNLITSTSPAMSSSTSAGRVMSNGRSQGPASRPSSPSPRVRSQQPIVPPDFPLDTPPNLRTTLPDRPVSAGRSRPGAALTMKSYPEATGSVNMPRRHSSPVVTGGRLTEPHGRSRTPANGHTADAHEYRRTPHISEQSTRRPVKSTSTASDGTGFGRTISKKSLDMAIRHMVCIFLPYHPWHINLLGHSVKFCQLQHQLILVFAAWQSKRLRHLRVPLWENVCVLGHKILCVG